MSTAKEMIYRYLEINQQIQELTSEKEEIAEALKDLAKEHQDTFIDGECVAKIQKRVKRSINPIEALKAITMSDPIHGPKAAEMSLQVSLRSIDSALTYLRKRIGEFEMRTLEVALQKATEETVTEALVVYERTDL